MVRPTVRLRLTDQGAKPLEPQGRTCFAASCHLALRCSPITSPLATSPHTLKATPLKGLRDRSEVSGLFHTASCIHTNAIRAGQTPTPLTSPDLTAGTPPVDVNAN